MTPLDLSLRPPQVPRAELEGIVFLPRSIDKIRARLPGGTPGGYNVTGLTTTMFDQLGIPVSTVTEVIAGAPSEAEVGTFVRESTTQAKIDAWNAFIAQREPLGGDRAEAAKVYPWLDERPDLRLVLDVLVEDDRRGFAK
jgi:hypothetical protein